MAWNGTLWDAHHFCGWKTSSLNLLFLFFLPPPLLLAPCDRCRQILCTHPLQIRNQASPLLSSSLCCLMLSHASLLPNKMLFKWNTPRNDNWVVVQRKTVFPQRVNFKQRRVFDVHKTERKRASHGEKEANKVGARERGIRVCLCRVWRGERCVSGVPLSSCYHHHILTIPRSSFCFAAFSNLSISFLLSSKGLGTKDRGKEVWHDGQDSCFATSSAFPSISFSFFSSVLPFSCSLCLSRCTIHRYSGKTRWTNNG